MKHSTINFGIVLSLIFIGIALRILPHPDNFAPVAAIAIFGGAVLPLRYGLWVPLVAMAVSDVIIGLHSLFLVIWACYLVIALASSTWLRKLTLLRGAVVTLSSSVFFFIVTNFEIGRAHV